MHAYLLLLASTLTGIAAEITTGFEYPVNYHDFDNGLNLYSYNDTSLNTVAHGNMDISLGKVRSFLVKYQAHGVALGGYIAGPVAGTASELKSSCFDKNGDAGDCVIASIRALGVAIIGVFGSAVDFNDIAGLVQGRNQIVNNVGSQPTSGTRGTLDAPDSQPCPNNNNYRKFWNGYYSNQDVGVKMFCENVPNSCHASKPDPSIVADLIEDLAEEIVGKNYLTAQFTIYYTRTKHVAYRCGLELETDLANTCPEEITGGEGCTYKGK